MANEAEPDVPQGLRELIDISEEGEPEFAEEQGVEVLLAGEWTWVRRESLARDANEDLDDFVRWVSSATGFAGPLIDAGGARLFLQVSAIDGVAHRNRYIGRSKR